MDTWFRISGTVTHVVKAGDAVAFFYVRNRRVTMACALRRSSPPVEYVSRVVQLGARVSVSGQIHGPFHDVLYVGAPPLLRKRVRLFCDGFAFGVAAGVRTYFPEFEGVSVWLKSLRARWANVREGTDAN